MADGAVLQDELKRLLEAVSEGNRAALRRLYELAAPRLFGIALRILRDREKAADVLVRVFTDLAQTSDGDSETADNPLARLVALTRSPALDSVRADGVEGHALDAFETDGDVDDPLAREDRSPDLTRLLACLGTLTEERRRMILYAYYDGWSREALSIYFDAPVHAVNTWIWRSIAELDAGLEP